MENIIKKLNDATKAYDEGLPIMSDKEWDDLYFKLVEMEKNSGIIYPNSPTQNIIYEVVNSLEKVEHNHKMLSLPKTKNLNEVKAFFNNKPCVAMSKLDGLTCSLFYKDGKLVKAETRGNGIIGENILHNALVIPSIPKRIKNKNDLVIDGEIICTYENFKDFSNEYKNPRNFAAGSIRLLDSKECEKRNLTFVAWDIIKGYEGNNFIDLLDYLDSLNFITAPRELVIEFNEELIEKVKEKSKDVPIDGVVFKYNDIAYGKSLGETSHHFNNAIAYKFYDEVYKTEILDIEWTLGRTGTLTPVAIFKPVEIDGTTIERASMHNLSIIYELFDGMPYYKQEIEVFKSNMIIPQIYSADKTEYSVLDHPSFTIPKECPICGGKTKIKKDYDSEVLICTNPNCEGQLINKLDHYCGKNGLDIRGLSKATLEKLIDWNWVSCISDIYTLNNYRDEWIKKPGFGVKSVDNILSAIENSKICDLSSFICAIGIPLIGRTASKDLAKHFSSWEDFREAIDTNINFYQFDNFGITMHYAITKFCYEEFDEIVKNYLTFNKKNDIINTDSSDDNLKNMIIVITGKLNKYKNRAELQSIIEQHGGKVASSVSKNTNYLINNDNKSTSAKNMTAKKLGVEVITEEEFIKKFF